MDNMEHNSANTQEVAEPVTQSENLQNSAQQQTSQPQTQDTQTINDAKEKTVQTQQDNAKFAAARRDAESKMRAQEDRMNKLARSRGFNNFDELERAVADEDQKRENAAFQSKFGIDPEAISPLLAKALENNPDIQNARRLIAETRRQKAEEIIQKEILEINKLDPSISKFEDLYQNPHYDVIDDLVRNKHYRIIDAFKLANFDDLQSKNSAAAKQSALNAIHSKSHLQDTSGNAGSQPDPIPADVYAEYKLFNPNASDEQIRKHWAGRKNRI